MSAHWQDVEDLRHDIRRTQATCRELAIQVSELQRVVSRIAAEVESGDD